MGRRRIVSAMRRILFVGLAGSFAGFFFLGAALDASAAPPAPIALDASAPPNKTAKIPPDHKAMDERMQWVFDLRWERGEVFLVQIHKTDMGGPHATPRVMGRFALELYEGPTLIERARFDFPMLGAPEVSDGGRNAPARLEPKLKTRIGVLFPATARGTRLELWDRAEDRRYPLPWPPQEGTFGGDAGN